MRLDPKVTRLPNGLRVVTVAMADAPSVSLGFWIGSGARHEPARLNGICHFLEHLAFKGTATRSARQISEAIEGRGGYCDAYTQEDLTCFHARVEASQWAPIFDILADMYLHPALARADLRKERAVIAEEIAMYREQPPHLADEMMMEGLYPGHPLGRPITGTPASLARMGRAEVRAFRGAHHVPANTVVAVAGPVPHAAAVRRVRRWLGGLPAGAPPGAGRFDPRTPTRPFRHVARDTDQVHAAIGFRTGGRRDPRRFGVKLMSVLLGETMSSRLFQSVREEHGLAYSINTGVQLHEETGLLALEAGLDAGKATRALGLIFRELRQLRERGPSAAELRRAQDYTVGQLLIGFEQTGSRMSWAGEQLLLLGRILEPAAVVDGFRAVTPAQVRELAREVFDPAVMSAAFVVPKGLKLDASRVFAALPPGPRRA